MTGASHTDALNSGEQLEVEPRAPRDEATVDEQGRSVRERIEGVVHERLQPHADHRGELMEVINFDHPFWTEPVPYSYCVTVRPGRIKGWGMHKLQSDRYFLLSGRMRVVLYDGRVSSPTYRHFNEFYFTESAHGLLLIPPGVWHADQNWGEQDAVLMNFPTRSYNRAEPDKYRIDPHSGEIPFDWALRDC